MANFQDTGNLPYLTNFKPYISQAPVIEEMGIVGREKQAKYDEGIQKIQGHIDQIAGIDVVRDIDKKYLQQSLNQLGGNLRKVAAGDFSNYQLVNSVGGMIDSISKDPNIQNAAYSTAKYRREVGNMESARKNGKSSPENEWYFANQANQWLSSGNIKDTFNTQYIEYTDVDKKLRDLAKQVQEVDNSIDIPYVRNASGELARDENNNPIVDDAMLRIKTKGKPAEKILSNFYDSLDEKDKQQLYITSNYHYRDANINTFADDIRKNYSSQRKILSDKLVNLNLELNTNPKLTSAQKSEIEAKVNNTNTKLNKTLAQDEFNALSELNSTTNINDLKYKLYTQKYLTNLANDLSYQSYQQEIVNNPYSQMNMEKAKLQLQYDNARRDQSNWEREFAFNKAKFFTEQAKKDRDENGSPIPTTPGTLSTDVDTPSLSKLQQEITSITGDKSKGILGQIDVLNSQYAPLIADKSMSTPEQKLAYLDGLSNTYAVNPSQVLNSLEDPNVREYLQERRALEIVAAQKQNLYNSAVEASKGYDTTLDTKLSQKEGLNDISGRPLYTAKELYDIGRAGTQFTQEGSDEAMRLIAQKGTGGLSRETILRKAVDVYRENYKQLENVNNQKLQFQSDYLSSRMPERQTIIGTLSPKWSDPTNIDTRRLTQVFGNKLNELEQLGQFENNKEFDKDLFYKLRDDDKTSYTIEKKYDGSANIILTGEAGKESIPISSSEFRNFFPNYAKVNPIQNIKDAILGSANRTTNFGGTNNSAGAVNAYLSGDQIPGLAATALAPLVRLDVEGSPRNDGSDSDRFAIRMYFNDNGLWKTGIITPDYINHAKLQAILSDPINGIGTRTVEEFIAKNR